MKQYIKIICRHCGSDVPVKNGHSENGRQRCRCNNCKKSFQTEYRYNARHPGVKDQTETQTLNSSGVGDIGRNPEISENTVISEFTKTPAGINPHFARSLNSSFLSGPEAETGTDAESDEFWSCAGNKGSQRRTWHAAERNCGIIPAWHSGRRTDESCSRLMKKLSVFPVKNYCTDDRGSCSGLIPSGKHVTGKSDTWKIG